MRLEGRGRRDRGAACSVANPPYGLTHVATHIVTSHILSDGGQGTIGYSIKTATGIKVDGTCKGSLQCLCGGRQPLF